ncbi:hemolysin family protein [Chitinilyticum piscinae]|uniref:HlyC/CorC family transporter n=1 Tax=Chitinilyticum piscinae TaxID=2866724 RepID=A0A8J7FI52_9NEIS|nr:hemolysin family protein [Chitinilyticum piscinae]MBE9609715.1 HlyC/CorC family transporter [Chitinilyticum piscinae]
MNNFLLIVAALLLVALNGFFVAAEFGLVKLRQTRVRSIAKLHGLRGRILLHVHGQLDAYLSACQLGITLASLGLGWIGEPAFAELLHPVLVTFGITEPKLVHTISFVFAFSVISFLHIVVGELAPKSMAIRKPEAVGLWTATPLWLFYWLMYPGIWLLNRSANSVLKLAGLDTEAGHDSHYSPEELKLILRGSRNKGGKEGEDWNVLAQAIDFSRLKVSDLMRPFHEAVALHAGDALATQLETIAQNRYSRYPLLDEEGHVQGVVHLKDVFMRQLQDKDGIDLAELARPVETVTPQAAAIDLFRRFRAGAPHFAVVCYDDEVPLGFVTLDNLLGAVVGEIRDEFRQARQDWLEQDDGTLIGKGSLPLFTLSRALGRDIDHPEAETIGGLIQWKLGSLPEEGQRIVFEHFDVVVKKMRGPRILLVRIMPKDLDEVPGHHHH